MRKGKTILDSPYNLITFDKNNSKKSNITRTVITIVSDFVLYKITIQKVVKFMNEYISGNKNDWF